MDVEFLDNLTRRFWPFIAEDGQEWVSVDRWLKQPGSMALTDGHGAFLVDRHEPGTYEVHTLFAGQARKSAMDACALMFTQTDCVEIVTKVPTSNPLALALAKRVGFKVMFSGGVWLAGGRVHDINFLRLSFEDWIAMLPAEDIEARYRAMLGMLPTQPAKAIVYYNRWARLYGAELLSLDDMRTLQ
jgi:hypothetical protein